MQLYGAAGTGSDIAKAMLLLTKSEYEFIDVTGFEKVGSARDRLAAINPLVQVPVLVLDDGTVMTETAAIALWLDRHSIGLLPALGSAEHAHGLRLLIWMVANVYPTFTYGDFPDRWAPSAAAELRAATDRKRKELYMWLDGQAIGPYVLGDSASALDCYMAVMIDWRPGRAWFVEHTPKLARIACLMRTDPRLR